MIEKLYIPTLGRVSNQKSYDGLPDKWKRKTYLVVQDQEYDEYEGFYNVIRLPKRLSGEYGRCSNAKAFIITELDNDCMYGILDDDLSYVYTELPSSKNRPSNRPLSDEEFDYIFEEMIPSWMNDGYIHIGQESTINIPRERDFQDNFRISQAVYYDGRNLDHSIVDWWRTETAEDFDCNLQLLRQGYPNRVSARYRIATSTTQAPGGCSLNRTVHIHNDAMRRLAENHKPFVTLYEKDNLMHPDDTVKKLGAKIQWKNAFKSSQGSISSLESFFS